MTFWIEAGKMLVGGVIFIFLVGLFLLVVGVAVHLIDKLNEREKE